MFILTLAVSLLVEPDSTHPRTEDWRWFWPW